MTYYKNLLIRFDSTRKSKARLGDSRTLQAKGIGNDGQE